MNKQRLVINILMLVILTVTVSAMATATAPTDYLSMWNWDNSTGSTLYDQNETSGNDGSIHGVTLSTDIMYYNKSGNSSPNIGVFDGTNDYVNFGTGHTFANSGNSFTIGVWIQGTSMGNSEKSERIIQLGNDYNPSLQLLISDTGTGTGLGIDFYDGTDRMLVDSGKYFNDGNPHLVVFTYNTNSDEGVLTIDGQIEETATASIDFNLSSEVFVLGRYGNTYPDDTNLYFDGKIGDAFVFPRVLSQEEISSIYNYGFTNPLNDNFSVSVTDQWSGSDINNITVSETEMSEINPDNTSTEEEFVNDPIEPYTVTTTFENYTISDYAEFRNLDNPTGVQATDCDYNPLQIKWSTSTLIGTGYVEIKCLQNNEWVNVDQAFEGGIDVYDQVAYKNYTNTTGNTVTTDILQNSTSLHNIKVDSSDYFPKYYVNYNVSSNLYSELYQSEINFSSYELFTERKLENVTYTIEGVENDTFRLSEGNYTVTAGKSGYYKKNKTFSVTKLDVKTINITGLYNNIINMTITDTTGADINTTWNSSFEDLDGGSVVNGSAIIPALQNNTYNITLGGEDYFQESTLANTTNTNLTTVEESLYYKNLIMLSFKKISDKSLIEQQVNYSVKSDAITYEDSTSSGTDSLEAIDGEYTLSAESSGYVDAEYHVNIPSSRQDQNVSVFMVSENGQSPIEFTVIDNYDERVTNAIVNIQIINNGTSYSIGQKETDFSGSVTFKLEEDIRYTVIVSKSGYTTFTGEIKPKNPSYTLRIEETGAELVESIFEDVHYQTDYNRDNESLNFTYFINSNSGKLTEYSFTTEYDGTTYEQTVTDKPSGGLETIQITDFDPLVQQNFEVTYSFTAEGTTYTWTENYKVLSDDSINVDFSNLDNGAKVLIAFGIMILLVSLGVAIAGVNGAYIFGIIGVGAIVFMSILPLAPGVVAMSVIILMLLAHNNTGDTV